ncbi:MAG: hypothetical protein MR051_03135 [Lentisphaeria bacterium]|nr:hypothetical protein [Lentisphaeria bacterium]
MMRKYQGITLDGTAVELTVEGGIIRRVGSVAATPGLPRLLPVLVDLQHNGALGQAYNNITADDAEALRRIAGHLLRHGVGRVLATFTTADYPRLKRAAAALRGHFEADALLNTLFPGIFHEGVFISPDRGWRGGHDPEFIHDPDWEEFRKLNELSGDRVRVVNVAPERPGALDFIAKAAASGIRVALGHCHPDSGTIHEAARAGASMVTHFANGAAPEIHRFHNPLWGFLDDPGLAPGLVGDGFHLPPEVVRTALRSKGVEHCFMVSDANIYSGCEPGLYHRIGGLDCVIEKNGFIHVADQEILAGAWFQQDRCVEFLTRRCGADFETAWKLASVFPARIAGIDLPLLREGDEASFVICAGERIQRTVFRGTEYLYEGKKDEE